MATEESNILQRVRIHGSKAGARLFRNSRGMFVTMDTIDKIRKLAKEQGVFAVLEYLNSGKVRMVRAGLEVPGSSDLIGWVPVTITPDMVGKQIAVFAAPEIKKQGGYPSKDQRHFMENVNKAGGMANVVRSNDDLDIMINSYSPAFIQE